jgi:hypothetical protein
MAKTRFVVYLDDESVSKLLELSERKYRNVRKWGMLFKWIIEDAVGEGKKEETIRDGV